MSDLGSSFNPQVGPHASPPPSTSWRRFAWFTTNSVGWKQWALLALPLLLVIPVVAGIAWFASKPNPLLQAPSKEQPNRFRAFIGADSSKPKPAPGKTRQEVAPPAPSSYSPLPPLNVQQPQPVGDVAIPAQNIAGAAPATLAPAVPTAQPAVPSRLPFSPAVYRAKHDKVFGGSCAGQLTLNSGGLVFNCPDDPHGSMQIALSEIGAVDENGVRLLSGKKYHFSIPGISKGGEEAIFANWLHQVR